MSEAQQLFEQIAATTWDTLESAHRNHFQFGEDAITSVNLHTFVNSSSRILAFEDTRAVEAKKGCDFELWIGTDQKGWYRYAAQAKKIDVRTRRYGKLKHMVGGQRQIDILNTYAKDVRAMPIYCLYSYASNVRYWNCTTTKMKKTQLGCMITPAAVIEEAMSRRGGQTFASLHRVPDTLPWRCLLHSPNHQLVGAGQCIDSTMRELKATRWASPESYRHASLPPHIEKRWRKRFGQREEPPVQRRLPPDAIGFVTQISPFGRESTSDSPYVEDESGMCPRWTLVVDTTDQRGD